ncbi:MAG: B12-binding domain-containing radical SAM protein, partial [Spirochaetes bacterium]|nr:B12-binding domain-containing radical SAM protein [Spirochaetota bacterium]
MKELLLIMAPPYWEKLPPAGIGYLAEYLKRRGKKVFFYDLNIRIFHELDQAFHKDWTINTSYTGEEFFNLCFKRFKEAFQQITLIIRKKKISHVGFSVLKSNRVFSIKCAEFIKRTFSSIKVIFGGPETFSMEQELYHDNGAIDHFVIGEGERALLGIIEERIKDKKTKFLELPKGKGGVDFFPRYEDFMLNMYLKKQSLPVVSSRGCLYQCRFCTERMLFRTFGSKDPRLVFEELQYHYEKNHIRHFVFYDSIFNGNLIHLESLLDLIIQNHIDITWEAQIAIRNDMPLTLLKKLKRSGCVNLFIGLESASDRILKLMNKGFRMDEAIEFFKKLKRSDLSYEISLIVHFPGETDEDFAETLRFIRDQRDLVNRIAQVNTFKNYPGLDVEIPFDYSAGEGERKVNALVRVLN